MKVYMANAPEDFHIVGCEFHEQWRPSCVWCVAESPEQAPLRLYETGRIDPESYSKRSYIDHDESETYSKRRYIEHNESETLRLASEIKQDIERWEKMKRRLLASKIREWERAKESPATFQVLSPPSFKEIKIDLPTLPCAVRFVSLYPIEEGPRFEYHARKIPYVRSRHPALWEKNYFIEPGTI